MPTGNRTKKLGRTKPTNAVSPTLYEIITSASNEMRLLIVLLLLFSTCTQNPKYVEFDEIVYALLKAELFGDSIANKIISESKLLISDTLVHPMYLISDPPYNVVENEELKNGDHEYLKFDKIEMDTSICDIWFSLPKARISYRVMLVKETNGSWKDKYADRVEY
ncbi:MAG: hypothetical protein ACR2MX_13900 [Cyclobacteriaceae bacterium]